MRLATTVRRSILPLLSISGFTELRIAPVGALPYVCVAQHCVATSICQQLIKGDRLHNIGGLRALFGVVKVALSGTGTRS